MSWVFRHLDINTRRHMLTEAEDDIRNASLYFSRDFCAHGQTQYPAVIRTACERGDVEWLATALDPTFFNATRTDKNGRVTRLNLHDSAIKFAAGEFNRFYLRGLCLRARAENVSELVVYRAKASENARPQSQAMIGKLLSIDSLLADLRQSKGIDTHLGLPPGPHSGLSACYS